MREGVLLNQAPSIRLLATLSLLLGGVLAAPPAPVPATPYVVTGTVHNVLHEPHVGVKVVATPEGAGSPVSATTDGSGRYRITLPRTPRQWTVEAHVLMSMGGTGSVMTWGPDDYKPFQGARGAMRDISVGPYLQESYGSVDPGLAHSGVELDYATLEVTFEPKVPNVFGHRETFTRRYVEGEGVRNVPLGSYYVSVSQVLNGVRQRLVISQPPGNRVETSLPPSTRYLAYFGRENIMRLFLNNP
ncbi:carboxypeptidase-like regulatory domain-containing protein [Deinococcus apachensis]|uniref:carboxypeptidase-like regulatory domain-containing protein n=1 Tax=Deinococcus apachensis TaxID=309886 RepID=UPI00036B9944|nr:carboxypeptidase-like regulatory domain-containing protein [Deinococcus apachensis]